METSEMLNTIKGGNLNLNFPMQQTAALIKVKNGTIIKNQLEKENFVNENFSWVHGSNLPQIQPRLCFISSPYLTFLCLPKKRKFYATRMVSGLRFILYYKSRTWIFCFLSIRLSFYYSRDPFDAASLWKFFLIVKTPLKRASFNLRLLLECELLHLA